MTVLASFSPMIAPDGPCPQSDNFWLPFGRKGELCSPLLHAVAEPASRLPFHPVPYECAIMSKGRGKLNSGFYLSRTIWYRTLHRV